MKTIHAEMKYGDVKKRLYTAGDILDDLHAKASRFAFITCNLISQ